MRQNKENKKLKICFAASSGGHLEQITMLAPLLGQFDGFLLTEKTQYKIENGFDKIYYLHQVNRREKKSLLFEAANVFLSIRVFLKEKPDVIICTGVMAMVPMCLLAKIAGRKLIFIESFAKVTSGTMTGKFLYHFADRFYVQWESMLEVYPKAIYLGGIY